MSTEKVSEVAGSDNSADSSMLSPQEAFESLQRMIPGLKEICQEEDGHVGMVTGSGFVSAYLPAINWGSTTSYKPVRWIPITTRDVVAFVKESKKLSVKYNNREGVMFGYSCPRSVPAIGVDFSNESRWVPMSDVLVKVGRTITLDEAITHVLQLRESIHEDFANHGG